MDAINRCLNISTTALPFMVEEKNTAFSSAATAISEGLRSRAFKHLNIQNTKEARFSFTHYTENTHWGRTLIAHVLFAISTLLLGFFIRLLISSTYRTSLWCAIWNQKLVVTTLLPPLDPLETAPLTPPTSHLAQAEAAPQSRAPSLLDTTSDRRSSTASSVPPVLILDDDDSFRSVSPRSISPQPSATPVIEESSSTASESDSVLELIYLFNEDTLSRGDKIALALLKARLGDRDGVQEFIKRKVYRKIIEIDAHPSNLEIEMVEIPSSAPRAEGISTSSTSKPPIPPLTQPLPPPFFGGADVLGKRGITHPNTVSIVLEKI